MSTNVPIFRSIEVGTGQHLTLGEPIPDDVLPLMHPAGPDRMMMNFGTYSGASTITVELGEDETIQQMDFTYAKGTSYQDQLENFTNELGAPSSGEGPGNSQSAVWVDDVTRFELFAHGPGDRTRVGSTLTNLATI